MCGCGHYSAVSIFTERAKVVSRVPTKATELRLISGKASKGGISNLRDFDLVANGVKPTFMPVSPAKGVKDGRVLTAICGSYITPVKRRISTKMAGISPASVSYLRQPLNFCGLTVICRANFGRGGGPQTAEIISGKRSPISSPFVSDLIVERAVPTNSVVQVCRSSGD